MSTMKQKMNPDRFITQSCPELYPTYFTTDTEKSRPPFSAVCPMNNVEVWRIILFALQNQQTIQANYSNIQVNVSYV